MSKNQVSPCKECAFLKTIEPGALGGSPPEVYIGQAEGPFMVPCHMLCDFEDPEWRLKSFETGQCAGMAVYRANLGITGLPNELHCLPPSPEVFGSHVEFLAHHRQIHPALATAVLTMTSPRQMMKNELSKSSIMFKEVKETK